MHTRTAGLRKVPVDWEALEDAFENNAPEVHSFLHLDTGEVLRIVDGIADPEMHSRIAADATYLRIEPVSSREQYRWMERFILMVTDAALRLALTNAIDGKGAFRRFKDVLTVHAEDRELWFSFRSERLRVFMEAWFTAHALVATPRAEWTKQRAEKRAEEGPPRVSDTPSLRERIDTALNRLDATNLEHVLAFARFLHSPRAPQVERSPTRDEGDEGPPPSEPRKLKSV